MTTEKDKVAAILQKLRDPFPPEAVGILAKPFKKDSPKGQCKECGGYHGLPAVHLRYVGHAALTHRLLDIDPYWNWEPMAIDQAGLPLFDRINGLWIRLTVCSVTRLGYGDADMRQGASAVKETIGDAIRNGAMRFGCALEFWHKGKLPPPGWFDPAEEETPKPLIESSGFSESVIPGPAMELREEELERYRTVLNSFLPGVHKADDCQKHWEINVLPGAMETLNEAELKAIQNECDNKIMEVEEAWNKKTGWRQN